jgi:hypothetical protein
MVSVCLIREYSGKGHIKGVNGDMEIRCRHTAEIMPPKRTNLVLATNIPHVELYIFVGHSLDVETNGWEGRDILPKLELVQNSGLSGGIKTEHEQAHFLRSEDLTHHLGELASHGRLGLRGACSLGRGFFFSSVGSTISIGEAGQCTIECFLRESKSRAKIRAELKTRDHVVN